ncbi:MAG: hypothetical protein WD315_06455, partial [Balneolaceae bacterium]
MNAERRICLASGVVRGRGIGRVLAGLVCLLVGMGVATEVNGQVEVNSSYSTEGARPNEEVTLTLSLVEKADLHYFGLMIEFDPESAEYLELNAVGITGGGAEIGGMFGERHLAVAVSRTDSTPIFESGDFMEVTFRLKSKADPGSLTF